MIKNLLRFFIFVLMAFIYNNECIAQEVIDSSSTDEIIIYNSDNTKIIKENNDFIRYLNGNVRIYHDSTFFFSDTAILKGKYLYAYGNIVIIQKDTVKIFSDTLIYNGDSLKAELIGQVALENGEKVLLTDHLYYDVHNKIGRYNSGAVLKQKSTELTSVRGVYYINENRINFNKYVAIKDSAFVLNTDSLDFDTDNRIAYFLDKTVIQQDSSVIYCEDGYYNIKTGNALFEKNMVYKKINARATADQLLYIDSLSQYILKGNAKYTEDDVFSKADTIIHNIKLETSTLIGNAIFKSKSQRAVGEKIVYNHELESFKAEGRSTINDEGMQITADLTNYSKKTGKGFASGNVEFVDTVSNIIIRNAKQMFIEKEKEYLFAFGDSTERMVMMFIDNLDTTYMSSDTLKSFDIIKGEDTTKVLQAYNNVKIFNKDYQSISDSLAYFPDDSIYILYNNPVLWSDSTQITGDTISIISKNRGIDNIYARNHGFITNLIADNLYNQIKGKTVRTYFKNDSLNKMDVDGNAETIYHMENDKQELTGTVKTVCSKIKFDFKNNQIKNIKFHGVPTSDLIPIRQEILNPHFLDGFKWFGEYRPLKKEDVQIIKALKIETNAEVGEKEKVNKTNTSKDINLDKNVLD